MSQHMLRGGVGDDEPLRNFAEVYQMEGISHALDY